MEELQSMSDSEQEIMKIIWKNGGSIFIADLLEQVEKQNKQWKRATVRTFLARLIEKGLIETKRHGKKCEYIAVTTREQYQTKQVRSFVEHCFSGNVKELLVSLFGQKALKKEEIEELERFWKEGKENLK